MTDKIKRIDIKEFREQGFLQEANRLFFHPLGLALEVVIEDDGTERLGGVWDYRDDPEGMVYGDGIIDQQKISKVEHERQSHIAARNKMFGGIIQSMITIDVYIVGDSISGRRQGLNKIAKGSDYGWDEMAMEWLSKNGYFQLIHPGNAPINYAKGAAQVIRGDDSPWVFTEGAWRRAEADPGFQLIAEQYAVNLKEMKNEESGG